MNKLLYFSALVLMSVCVRAEIVDVKVYDDCSKNGYTKVIDKTGTAEVLSSSGRTSCEWVQLWEGGPKWATFNVGATITDYAQLTVGADATSFYNYTEQAPYYNTANVGGLYPWNNPNFNGRTTTWTSSVSTGISDVATTLWGSNWKTPTQDQLVSLFSTLTTWTWCDGSTIQYVAGCTLKGYKVSGVGDYANNSIFLPAAGYFNCFNNPVSVYDASSIGYYWSSTESNSSSALELILYLNYHYMYTINFMGGQSVRAVLADVVQTAEEYQKDSIICYGESIMWRGKTCDETKAYYDTLRYTGTQCDSVHFTLNLTVTGMPIDSTKDTTICYGDHITWRGQDCYETKAYHDTLRYTGTQCDSVLFTLNLIVMSDPFDVVEDMTICSGDYYFWRGKVCYETKTYHDTVRYAGSQCDSIRYILNLTVMPYPFDVVEDTTICYGDAIIWRGKLCDETWAYHDTLRYGFTQCDSIRYILNLTVMPYPFDVVEDTTICYGDAIMWRGQLCDETKAYYDTVRYAATQCDSAYYCLFLTIHQAIPQPVSCEASVAVTTNKVATPLSTDIAQYTSEGIVKGERPIAIPITSLAYKKASIYGSIYINAQVISPSGQYIRISECVPNSDSYYKRSSHPIYNHYVDNGEYLFFDLQALEQGVWTLDRVQQYAGTWKYTLSEKTASYTYEVHGDDDCGTIAISDTVDAWLTMTAVPAVGKLFEGWSDGSTDNPRTILVTQDTTYVAVFTIDSTYVENDPNIFATICKGDYYDFHGQKIYREGVYTDTLLAHDGKDSVVTLTLTIANSTSSMVMDTIYEGDTYLFNGEELTKQGMYNATLKTIYGCDSTVMLVLIVLPQPQYIINATSNNTRYGIVEGGGLYTRGTTAVLEAKAAENYHFTRWSDGDIENPREIVAMCDTSLVALFAINKYSIIVEANDPLLGSVSGGGEYLKDATAILMAHPYAGNTFVRWEDGVTLNPRSVNVFTDSLFTAVFECVQPIIPEVASDTLVFTDADNTIMAVRVYSPSEIKAYDKFVIGTVDNRYVMGAQIKHYRYTKDYSVGMNLSDVSVVEAIPADGLFRLKVEEGYLTPGANNSNALYSREIGADWTFMQYDKVVIPQAVYYNQRMILYNELAPRFSSYRQVTGLDRHQTTIYKLRGVNQKPQDPMVIEVDPNIIEEYADVIDDIPTSVVPSDTVVTITTPYVDFVFTFTVIVWADMAHTQCVAILTFTATGQLISISTQNVARRATKNNDISFDISGLLPETKYYYTIMACDDDGSALETRDDSFTTSKKVTTDMDSVDSQKSVDAKVESQKILRNGILIIERNGIYYNAQGAIVE